MEAKKSKQSDKDLTSSNDYEIPIGDNYKLNAKKKLGSGAFGDIYYGKNLNDLGMNVKANEEVAIKLVKN